MNIDSTENERYQELKDKMLMVVPWDPEECSDFIAMTNPDVSVSKYVRSCASQLGICQKKYHINGIMEEVKFNRISVKESIAAMCRQRSDLSDLVKLFTVLDDVISNAIQIEVEAFRHKTNQRVDEVLCMHQYISAFCDDRMVYPVKITVEERKKIDDTYIHVVVTIGKIKKEVLSIYEYVGDATSRPRNTSFAISIPEFVKHFNRKHNVLLKNLPDQLLTKEQMDLKQKVKQSDDKREQARLKLQEQKLAVIEEMRSLQEKEYQLDYEPEDEIELD